VRPPGALQERGRRLQRARADPLLLVHARHLATLRRRSRIHEPDIGADHVRVRCEYPPSKGTAIMSNLALATRYRAG